MGQVPQWHGDGSSVASASSREASDKQYRFPAHWCHQLKGKRHCVRIVSIRQGQRRKAGYIGKAGERRKARHAVQMQLRVVMIGRKGADRQRRCGKHRCEQAIDAVEQPPEIMADMRHGAEGLPERGRLKRCRPAPQRRRSAARLSKRRDAGFRRAMPD